MRHLCCFLIFLFLLSCASLQPPGSLENTAPVSAKDTPLGFTDSLRLWGLVNYLASDSMRGRETGSPEIELAAEFLEENLRQYSIAPFYPAYRDTLKNTRRTAYNVVGVLPGKDPQLRDEYVVIGAHYDHIGTVNRINGDAIANGANDNASGTASVLEISRYFGRSANNKRSIIFAFFSAEEKGLLGSKHLAERMQNEGLDLYLMLNFEMTGVPMPDKDFLLYITGYSKSNLAAAGNAYASEKLIGYLPTENDYNLFQRSDNYPFYRIYNIPSHTFCTFDFNNYPQYHKSNDEADQLDYNHMAEVVNKIIPVIEGLVNSSEQRVRLN